MSEQQIHDGFERLGGALAPPPDVLARVEARVRTRRRRRRTAVGGAAVLALAAVGGGAVALTGGSEGTSDVPVAVDTPAPPPTLTITRPDGTSVLFTADQLDLRCRGAQHDITKRGGRWLELSSPMLFDESQQALTEPYFYVELLLAGAEGRTFSLPYEEEDGSSAGRALTVFMADAGRDHNEVSSAEGGASGTVRVLRASCDPTPVLELEVDATLGSEVGQAPYAVRGTYR